jgi:hypothetical protein
MIALLKRIDRRNLGVSDGRYYVYVYIDPRNNEEFYYGKGTMKLHGRCLRGSLRGGEQLLVAGRAAGGRYFGAGWG